LEVQGLLNCNLCASGSRVKVLIAELCWRCGFALLVGSSCSWLGLCKGAAAFLLVCESRAVHRTAEACGLLEIIMELHMHGSIMRALRGFSVCFISESHAPGIFSLRCRFLFQRMFDFRVHHHCSFAARIARGALYKSMKSMAHHWRDHYHWSSSLSTSRVINPSPFCIQQHTWNAWWFLSVPCCSLPLTFLRLSPIV